MMTDYYSTGYATKEAAQAAIDALRDDGAVSIDGPFQIVRITAPGDEQTPATTECDGLWYFNVRVEGDDTLSGDWVEPEPATPFRVWA